VSFGTGKRLCTKLRAKSIAAPNASSFHPDRGQFQRIAGQKGA